MGQEQINIDLNQRKSIEYYNKNISTGKLKPGRGLLILRYLATVAGYGLLIGIFVAFFFKPWYYGLIISLTAIYIRYLVWKIMKKQALFFTKQQALQSEGDFKGLYDDQAISLKNLKTGKIVQHPEKWTQVFKRLD